MKSLLLASLLFFGSAQCFAPASAYAQTQDVKKYQATITTKDGNNNTKTFTDYCDAKSNSEATSIFKGRYPSATISGVREV
jgi:hypothetical protein